MKLDILVIGVHPDDIELGCSGTILRHVAEGKKVGGLDLTHGELGTRGSAELRLKEAAASAKILGLSVRENIGIEDGFFEYNRENLMKIVHVIRKYKPDIVLTNALSDRHPDHGRASKLSSDACFYSGLMKIETGVEAWRPKAVYHYIQDHNLVPDFVVDISPYMEDKIKSIMAYSSQFFDPDSDEPDTPISSSNFIEFVKGRSRAQGRPIGAAFGEGFNVERTIGVNDLFDLV